MTKDYYQLTANRQQPSAIFPIFAPMSFADFKLNRQLWSAIEEAGFERPTEVQQLAIPHILSGVDVLGVAQTGTGKTAAYVIPMLFKIKYAQGKDPRALIVVPTRELAFQVRDHITMLAKYTDLRSVVLVGGTGTKSQNDALKAGVDIVVATPGRLMDMYLSGALNLKYLQMFILDEAERLLDMGFKPQIDRILEVVPRKRQNLLFSATWSDKVRRISEDFLLAPVEVHVQPEVKTVKTVTQKVLFIPNLRTKINMLEYLLAKDGFDKVMIFCKTKEVATNISKYLARKYGEEKVRVIHGNKDQNTRMNAMKAFSDDDIDILVATDVAARGIDIRKITHVINFDVPLVYQDYIHRIGRTGRAEETGDSITFCAPHDEWHLKKIEKLIGQKIPVEEMPAEVTVEQTPFEELQQMRRDIDMQKRKDDPEFQGAFHEKKWKKDKKR
jgi:ATP-dependent RNA helicase RhlE